MKLKKGDTVLIISGKDRGKKGKIIKVFPKDFKILVEGVNLKKKHLKPRREGEKGQIVQIPAPFPASKAKLICPKCSLAVRVGWKIEKNGEKFRICKKCQALI
jgi:large subunit ribosomal protein L24